MGHLSSTSPSAVYVPRGTRLPGVNVSIHLQYTSSFHSSAYKINGRRYYNNIIIIHVDGCFGSVVTRADVVGVSRFGFA